MTDDGNTQHGAVRCNEREKDAKRLIKWRDDFLQEHFNELHKGCDDKDEANGLEVSQIVWAEQIFLHAPGYTCRHGRDKYNGQPHAYGDS